MPEAERVFGILAERDWLRSLDVDAFADGLAWVWGETTAIHPFRDVNTRSQHVFFTQLARDAGWVIDWSQTPGDVFAHARTLAIVEDHSGLDALIRPNLVTVEDSEQRDRLIQHLKEHTQGFTTRKTARDPDVLDRELDAARERRRTL
ncbi:hypothetical protein KILIM_016_00960, partial [Kineosphaera limosa NBRC 100340]